MSFFEMSVWDVVDTGWLFRLKIKLPNVLSLCLFLREQEAFAGTCSSAVLASLAGSSPARCAPRSPVSDWALELHRVG